MSKTIYWGIIGIGKIAEKFAADLSTVENAKLAAVASTSIERAKEFGSRHQADHAFGSYEEIFDAPNLDAIYIATPHTLHAANTKLCLKHQVAVLCEKPFAMNQQEVQEMVTMAREKNTFLMEALWSRFLPSTKKMLEITENGLIGNIKNIQIDFGFVPPFFPERRVLNPSFGGGAFLDIGLYPAVFTLMLLGYPEKILASSTKGPTGVDESTSFIYHYEQGAIANLSCTFGANTNTAAYIYGDKGHMQLKSKFHESKELVLNIDGQKPQSFAFPRETFGYDFEIREVNECLRAGKKESSLWPLSQSQNLIQLLDETRKKAGIIYETDNF